MVPKQNPRDPLNIMFQKIEILLVDFEELGENEVHICNVEFHGKNGDIEFDKTWPIIVVTNKAIDS